jgi:hypothetical protein
VEITPLSLIAFGLILVLVGWASSAFTDQVSLPNPIAAPFVVIGIIALGMGAWIVIRGD